METPKPNYKHPVLKPIRMDRLPLMPVPRMSTEAAETWIWGDFYLTFQKNPPAFLDLLHHKENHRGVVAPTKYPFVISVFYRKDKSTSSSAPILVVAVEAYSHLATPVLSFFSDDSHNIYGPFQGMVSAEAARLQLLAIAGEKLNLIGKPHRLEK